MQKKVLKETINRALGLIMTSPETWNEIVTEKKPLIQTRKDYLYPFIIIAVVLSFCSGFLHAKERGLEFGILGAITTLIACGGGYFIASLLCFNYLKRYRPELASRSTCEILVCYSYTIYLLISIFISIFPSLSFLVVLNLFVAYVLWNGSAAVWQLEEEDRVNIVLVFSPIIFLSPLLIQFVLSKMITANF